MDIVGVRKVAHSDFLVSVTRDDVLVTRQHNLMILQKVEVKINFQYINHQMVLMTPYHVQEH